MGRPEGAAQVLTAQAAGSFYDANEAARYTAAAERTGIQLELSERALHLLHSLAAWGPGARSAAPPQLLVDVGCGAGASSEMAERYGHCVIGLDLSESMLTASSPRHESVCWDMSAGLPFRRRPLLDGAISISALQWLCSDELEPQLCALLTALHECLRPGAACVAQFYPSTPAETLRVARAAARCGWGHGEGGTEQQRGSGCAVVFDLPHATRATRLFLCLERGEDERLPSHDVHSAASALSPVTRSAGRTADLALCPCAWPHAASCALQLHLRSGAHCEVLAARLGSAAGSRDAWRERLEREHQLLAKRLQHTLQLLWKEAKMTDAEVQAARERLRQHQATPPAPLAAGDGGAVAMSRRSRLEAWAAGEAKARARHMEGAWREASAAGARALVADAEAEILAMRSLPCFECSADLYLCRTKRRR